MDFEEVYTREFPGVYKYLLALSGNPALAEELTQETFYRAIQSKLGKISTFLNFAKSGILNRFLQTRQIRNEPPILIQRKACYAEILL